MSAAQWTSQARPAHAHRAALDTVLRQPPTRTGREPQRDVENSALRRGASVSIPRGTGRHSHTFVKGVRNEARNNRSPRSSTAFAVYSPRMKRQRLSQFTEHCTDGLARLVLDWEFVSHSAELPSAADGLSRCDLARKQSQAPRRAQPDCVRTWDTGG